jgi:putative FmdB family regulatory protein
MGRGFYNSRFCILHATMPIYAYKCESCGFRQDVLQKISDPAMGTCPSCGAQSFVKQVTAAGFQLKGSGWYVTDFRGGSTAASADKADVKPTDAPAAAATAATAAAPAAGADKPAAPPGDKPGPPGSEAA